MATDLRKGKEKEFYDTLVKKSIWLEAFIVRNSHREWAPALYIFRFQKDGKNWSEAHILPWKGEETFAEILGVIEGKRK